MLSVRAFSQSLFQSWARLGLLLLCGTGSFRCVVPESSYRPLNISCRRFARLRQRPTRYDKTGSDVPVFDYQAPVAVPIIPAA